VKSAIAWFARNPVAANLLMIVIVGGGLITLPRITQQVFPEVRTEVVTISVPYRGAAPEEVEESICIRIEERIQSIDGIKRLTSVANEGAGVVTAELKPDSDVRRVLDEVQAQVDAIDSFPVEAEKPIVQQQLFRSQVVNVVVTGTDDLWALRRIAQRVRDDIVALPHVTHAEVVNTPPYEISIEVSESGLSKHQLTFDEVIESIRRSSIDVPGGTLKTEGGEILLRTKGQAYTGRDFEDLVLVTRVDGSRLTLGEVARVVDGFEETDQSSRFNGEPAVMIQVFRVGDQGALEVAAEVRDYIERTQTFLPDGIRVTTWQDWSFYLRDRLDTMLGNARLGFVLVLIVLALFLRLRFAFWIGIGIPIAILGTLMLLPLLGISINMLSLFAFVLVLGILVDDAIVVGENVYTHQTRHNDGLRAAIEGTQEVSVPVVFGVLTTMAAFSPLLMIPGTMGNLIAAVPIIVITALTFSLIEAKLILPTHLIYASRESKVGSARGWRRVQDAVSGALERFLSQVYTPFLAKALEWRYLTAAVGVGAMIVTSGLVVGGWTRFVFLPDVEGDYVAAFLSMPQGTPAEATTAAIRQIEEAAERVRAEADAAAAPDTPSVFRHVLSSVGGQPRRAEQERDRSGRAVQYTSAGHLGEVSLELAANEDRRVTAEWLSNRWREETGPIPDAVELSFSFSVLSAGEAINVELRSNDMEMLKAAAADLKAGLGAYPGVYDVGDSFRGGKQELKLRILPSAEALGLSLSDLARQVRQAFYGDEVQRIQRGRDEVRVMVRYPSERRRSLGDIERMWIRRADARPVPFTSVAEVEYGRGFAQIKRADRKRVIAVTASVDLAQMTPNEVMGHVRKVVLPEIVERYPGLTFTLEGEQRQQREFLEYLQFGFTVALFLIFTLLAIPLGSYVQPLIVMSAIPFGLIGAIWGHVLTGWDLNFFSSIGMVALSGVVVNDSLVLVDYVNRLRARGLTVAEAAREAGVGRFRPILLTSLTTAAGLTPLMLGQSLQAQFLIPMAVSLAFGVLFATAVTLILVPAWYMILEDAQALRGGTEAIPREGTEAIPRDGTEEIPPLAPQSEPAQ